MNPVDLVCLVGLGTGLVLGALRGWAYSILVLAKIVAASFLALALAGPATPLIEKVGELPDGPARDIVPWLAVFVLLLIFLTGLLALARRPLKRARSLRKPVPGALCGLVSAFLLLNLLVPIAAATLPRETPAGDALVGSRVFDTTQRGARTPVGRALVPGSFTAYLAAYDQDGVRP